MKKYLANNLHNQSEMLYSSIHALHPAVQDSEGTAMLTTSMNIHDVTKITVEPECVNKTYGARTIRIETETGAIEITLFSKRQEEDDEKRYMQFVM